MFCITGATRFKYIPNYKDMRGGYDKLHGVVCSIDGKQEEGTAYVFTSKNQKLVKIIRHENNECQLYVQRFDHNMSFIRLEFDGVHPIFVLEYKYLLALLSCPVIKRIDSIEVKYDEKVA